MSETKVVVALLAGLAAGAALGLLFAPEAGSEMREKISGSFNELVDSLKDMASEQIESLTDAIKGEAGDKFKASQPDDLEHA